MTCQNCGAELEFGVAICQNCGAHILEETSNNNVVNEDSKLENNLVDQEIVSEIPKTINNGIIDLGDILEVNNLDNL